MEGHKKKIKRLLFLADLNMTIIPCAIILVGGWFNTYNTFYIISMLGVSILWSLIIGRAFLRRFKKLREGSKKD
jgi:hypothetical protein